jgi:hypothetical protein
MKLSSVIVILLSSFCLGFIMPNTDERYPPSKGEQMVNSTLSKTAHIIQNKYKLRPSGTGASMPGGPIRSLFLSFDTKNRYTKECLRKLVIESAQELLNQVTSNENIQQYLFNSPFTIKDVEIVIYNHDKDGRGLRDPEISVVGISEGILKYKTVDPEDIFSYKNEYEETYEEALKILQTK